MWKVYCFIFCIGLVAAVDASAQQLMLKRTVISTSSPVSASADYDHIVLTQVVGQSSPIKSYSVSELILSQGFLQPLTSLGSIVEKLNFKLYPNPANSSVTLLLEKLPESSVQIDIFSIKGRHMKSMTIDQLENTIQLEDLPKSIYFIRARSESMTATTHKLILE